MLPNALLKQSLQFLMPKAEMQLQTSFLDNSFLGNYNGLS